MRRIIAAIFIAVSLTFVAPSTAVSRTKDARHFLRETAREGAFLAGMNARILGFGGAGAALRNEPGALLWNPAALSAVEGLTGSFSDALDETTGTERRIGGSAAVNLRTISDEPFGTVGVAAVRHGWGFDPRISGSYVFGYGSEPISGIAFGLGLRYEERRFETASFFGWGLDIGLRGETTIDPSTRLMGGVAVSRIGLRLRDGTGTRLPIDYSPLQTRIGAALILNDAWTIAYDASYIHDVRLAVGDRWRWHFGIEYAFFDRLIAVRAGLNVVPTFPRIRYGLWSAGASLRLGGGTIDYAFLIGEDGFRRDVDGRHVLTISFGWNGTVRNSSSESETAGELILPDARPPLVRVENEVFSPNGDGVRDAVLFHVRGFPSPVRLVIFDRDDTPVWEFEPTSTPIVLEWRGLTEDGEPFPDGLYLWRLFDGEPVLARGAVTIDTGASYRVLVASFREIARARAYQTEVESAGFLSLIETTDIKGTRWYRVVVGPYRERAEAERVRADLREKLDANPIILRSP